MKCAALLLCLLLCLWLDKKPILPPAISECVNAALTKTMKAISFHIIGLVYGLTDNTHFPISRR